MTEPKLRFKKVNGEDYPDWEEKTLGDLGTVKMCKRVLKEQTSNVGEIPFYKIGTFGGTPDAYISRELFTELKNKFSYPRKGDILLSAAGTIGRTVVYDGEEAFFQDSNIVWLEHDESIISNFLYQFYKRTSWENLEGGTIKRLYNGLLLAKKINLPCLEEQQKIADLLSSVDEVITTLTEEVRLWEEKKKGVMQKIFSQEARFKDENGEDYPEWEEKRFYDCVDINANMVQPDVEIYGDLPHIGPGNIEKATGKLLEYKLVKDENLVSGKYLFSETDVIYCKINPQLMKVAFPKMKGLCSADAYPVSAKPEIMFPEFLFYSLLETRFIKYSISVSMRTGMPKINRDELGLFKFIVPCLEEQQKIADCLSGIDEVIAIKKQKLETWKNIKKGLLQQMFV